MIIGRNKFKAKKIIKVGSAIALTKGGGGQIVEYFTNGGIGRYS
ncbi:acinetodin/klebsidin/J25 family lasso peptide [Citrobacter sp. JGM124]|nr:acinetodin/klebsidin/J25 family lasso peptide [Citrobacter sp. JGM124]